MFIKEKDFHKYSLEQFKEWLRKAAPEDDWSEIKVWGMLYRFDSIALDNKEILEYLFQLGLNPKFIYSKNIDTIRSIEQGYRDPFSATPKTIVLKLKEVCKAEGWTLSND